MSRSSQAVFLSYASEDADAVRGLCDALRAAKLEVWFDQSELRGGDAWDASIRRRIKDCGLFVPVISANTEARREGYFRLEWKLAVDRSFQIADEEPFLLPVAIGDIHEATARVPDRFREIHWSRASGAGDWSAFADRARRLLAEGAESERVASRSLAEAPISANALSIVVLPFVNRTGDPQQEYVADGITESLTSDLSRIRDALVVASMTAFAYKSKAVTARQVGKDLGVRFVLQGSVQRGGGKIRINAQLADATTNAQIWSENFEGDESDMFSLQDRVTTRIGNSIGREMVIVAARERQRRRSDASVTDMMLRARALNLRPRSLENLRLTEVLYRQVLELEPDNAAAMVDLACSLAVQAFNFGYAMEESAKESALAEAKDLASRATKLDPDNPDIYLVMGLYAYCHEDFPATRRAAESRLALAPKDRFAYHFLATTYFGSVEPRKVIELETQAINLDPKHPLDVALNGLCSAHLMLGDYDAAIEWGLKTLERNASMGETYANLAMAYALKGDEANARKAAAELLRITPTYRLSEMKRPRESSPKAYKEFWENVLLPAARKAGVPE